MPCACIDPSHLRIPVPEKAAVIDVCGPADDQPVVDDHELGVDVDELGDGRVEQLASRSQGAEGQVVDGVDAQSLQSAPETRVSAADGRVVVVQDHPKRVPRVRPDLALERRKQGQQHEHAERLGMTKRLCFKTVKFEFKVVSDLTREPS